MNRLGYSRVRRAGRRLGRGRHAGDGHARRPRGCSASTPTCPARPRPTSSRGSSRRAGAVGPLRRGARAYEQLSTFYAKHVAYAQIMSTRPQTLYGLADSPVDLAAFALDHGDGTGQPGLVKQVLEGQPAERPHARRPPRQHHALLADQHRGLRGPPVLGEQGGLLRRQGHLDPVRHQRLPRRALPGPAQLGRARLPGQPHPLQRGSTEAATSRPGSSPSCFAEELRAAFRSLRT